MACLVGKLGWPLFNPLITKLYLSYLKTQSVPRSKHSASVLKNR